MRVVSTRDTRGRRGRETARDMLWSMAAVFAAVAAVLVLAWPTTPEAVKPVQWRPVITAVADSADWPVVAPATPPARWTATSARVERLSGGHRVVHVGWVTDDAQYVSVRQVDLSGVDAREWLLDEIGTADPGAEKWTDNSGRMWSVATASDAVALVTEVGATTVVVTGTAPQNQMQRMAAALTQQ